MRAILLVTKEDLGRTMSGSPAKPFAINSSYISVTLDPPMADSHHADLHRLWDPQTSRFLQATDSNPYRFKSMFLFLVERFCRPSLFKFMR